MSMLFFIGQVEIVHCSGRGPEDLGDNDVFGYG
jgi:hypothetical protein